MKPTSHQIQNKSSVAGSTLTEALEALKTSGGASVPSWESITDKPATFPPSTHTHTDKQDTLVSGTNIKTINGSSILGSGDLVVAGGGGGGVTDHGALTGLSDDDHSQYHNDARGDARYVQLSNIKTINGNSIVGTGNIVISGGGGLTLNIVTGTTQAVTSGNEYALTNVAATTLTAPASATVGDKFAWDVCNGLTTNTINWNGLKHEGLSDSTMTLTGPYESGEAIYISAAYGWKVK